MQVEQKRGNQPEVAVILPFYNPGNAFAKALQSILEQTLTNFELLLIDNASSDQSYKHALEISRQDKRVRLLREHKRGVVYAVNTGIKEVSAPFICRMDADDIAAPERLQWQVAFLRNNPQFDAVAGKAKYASLDAHSEGFKRYMDWQNDLIEEDEIALNRFIELPFPNPTLCWRAKLTSNGQLFREGNFPEDYEFWLRAWANGARIAKIPRKVITWMDNDKRLTRNDSRYSEKAFHQIKSGYIAHWLKQHNPYYPEIVVWGAGRKSRKYAAFLTEHGIRITYFLDIKRRDIPGYACYHFSKLPEPGNVFIVSYVGSLGAKEEIRSYLHQRNYIEGKDFIMAS